MEVADAGGEEEELDMLQAGESEGVHRLDGIVVDDEHGDVLRASKGVAGYCVDPVIPLHKSIWQIFLIVVFIFDISGLVHTIGGGTDVCKRLSRITICARVHKPVHKISTDLCLMLSLGLPGRSD